MRIKVPTVCFLLLIRSGALAQSYDMIIHLHTGGTVTISNDEIQRIEFADLLTGVMDPADPGRTPLVFQVLSNQPNPFNPSTTIEYEIANGADVTVRVFDLNGALVKELLHETQTAGRHQVSWNGTDGSGARVSSGVYFCMVECGEQALSRRLILVK